MEPRFPTPGRSRETSIRRDAQGHWFNDGVPITHPKLVRAFDRWLERADDGRFCLRNDINWAYVQVEGAPLFVRRVEQAEDGLRLGFSNGFSALLNPATLRQGPDGALYCDEGSLVARFDRPAMHQLGEFLGEDEVGVYVEVAGVRVRVPTVNDPLRRS